MLLLLLVLAQREAIAHQISHAAQQSTHQAPADDAGKACDKCLALAQFGGGIPVSLLIFGVVKTALICNQVSIAGRNQARFVSYRSRAPPFVL